MRAPVFPFEFDVDREWLLEKALQEPRRQFYHHGKKEERIEGYKYAIIDYPELQELVGRFALAIKGRWNMKFVYIAPNTTIGWHKDWGTKCAFNWVINGNNAAIKYRDRPYAYSSAIINTQEEHMVKNNDRERILFKIALFDKSYEETCKQFSSQFL
jgi:hypothetical protein|tara:strand:+ start:1837 stop:2307 length:471 start_codon:yes stop_codon:yes gene_type:complete